MSHNPASINPVLDNDEFQKLYNNYRSNLLKSFMRADLAGVMEASEDVPINLRDIYIPLRLAKEDLPNINSSEQVENIKGTSLTDAIKQHQFIAISGMPGSGKTTLTQFLTQELSHNTINASINKLGRQLVIPIILRELDFSHINSFTSLLEQWRNNMEKMLQIKIPLAFLNYFINRGWALLIFDGIDEIGNATNQQLMNWIGEHLVKKLQQLNSLNNKRLYCIITGRPSGYLVNIDYEKYFEKLYLQPFNQEQIEAYSRNWYKIRYPHDGLILQEKNIDFINKLKAFSGLAELKHRPIYLAMLAYVAETYGELPVTRTLAYSKMIDAYIHQLELLKKLKEKPHDLKTPIWSHDDKLRVMEELAFRIHTSASEEIKKQGDYQEWTEQMQIVVSHQQLSQYIEEIIETGRFMSIPAEQSVELTNYLIARTGLLIEPTEGSFQFSHLTFQEFLTAKRISRKLSKRNPSSYLTKHIFSKIGQPGWREVCLLYFGIDKLNAGEGHGYILQTCWDENNKAHQRFLIDLLITTDYNLSQQEVTGYLNALVYIWMLEEKADFDIYQYLATKLTQNNNPLTQENFVADFIKSLLAILTDVSSKNNKSEQQALITLKPTLFLSAIRSECEEFEEIDENENSLYNRLIKLINQAKAPSAILRLLNIAYYLPSFSVEEFNICWLAHIHYDIKDSQAISKEIKVLTLYNQSLKKNKESLPLQHIEQALNDHYFRLMPISYFTPLSIYLGDEVFLANYTNELAQQIKKLTLVAWASAQMMFYKIPRDFFDIESTSLMNYQVKSDLEIVKDMAKDMTKDMIRDMVKASPNRAMAMVMAMDMAKDMANDITKDMAMAVAMDMAMTIDRGVARGRVRIRDIAIFICLARKMAKDMAKEMAIDIDIDLAIAVAMTIDKSLSEKRERVNKECFTVASALFHHLWHFYLYLTATKAAKKTNLILPPTIKEYNELYQQIATDESAIAYFNHHCPADEINMRKSEIIYWLSSPASPRNMLKTWLTSMNSSKQIKLSHKTVFQTFQLIIKQHIKAMEKLEHDMSRVKE